VDYYDRQHGRRVLMSRVGAMTPRRFTASFTSSPAGFLLQILQVVGVGVMLFTLNARLALWTLVPMCPWSSMEAGSSGGMFYPRYYRYWDAASKQAGALAGMLAGIRVVKAFAQEEREFDRFQATSDRLRQSRLGVKCRPPLFRRRCSSSSAWVV